MKKEIFLNKWYNKEIEDDGAFISEEYSLFQKSYKSVIKDICKDIDFELEEFNKYHYCFSAVLSSKKTEQLFYISISDVRYFKNEWANNILYRTMKDEKDWIGGSNHFSTLNDISKNLLRLDNQILKEKETRQVVNRDESEIEF